MHDHCIGIFMAVKKPVAQLAMAFIASLGKEPEGSLVVAGHDGIELVEVQHA